MINSAYDKDNQTICYIDISEKMSWPCTVIKRERGEGAINRSNDTLLLFCVADDDVN